MKKKTLALITNGFEEIEAVTPFDLLHRAGIELTIAAIGADAHGNVVGRSDLALKTHVGLDALAPDGSAADFERLAEQFDALLLPGGPGTFSLREEGRAAKLAAAFAKKGKIVAAICAAPLLLLDAGLLSGKRVSAYPCTWDEIPAAKNSARVELDGNILTSRGAGTAFDFALALVECLAGKAVATKISADTMN